MATAELLMRYVELLNQHGPNSGEAEAFRQEYAHNQGFVELADMARRLKLWYERDDGIANVFAKLHPTRPSGQAGAALKKPQN